jgi:hypothetical protein
MGREWLLARRIASAIPADFLLGLGDKGLPAGSCLLPDRLPSPPGPSVFETAVPRSDGSDLRVAVREWLLFQIVEVEDLPLAYRFTPA